MSGDVHHAAPGVVITQRDVYDQVQAIDDKLDKLTTAVGEMVAINKRLDSQHARQNTQGERVRNLEVKMAALLVVDGILVAAITGMVVKVFAGV